MRETNRRIPAVLAVLFLAILAASPAETAAQRRAPPPPPMPAKGAADFYNAYVRAHTSGIPSARQRVRLTPFLSTRLHTLLQDAERAEFRYAEATRHEVPPLVEGDIFTSLFEGATAFKVGLCTEQGETASCAVELTYHTENEGDTKWTDTVSLVREERRFRVDDVTYGGAWAFSNKGKLSDLLTQAIAEGNMPAN
jgi:hypothetical protein